MFVKDYMFRNVCTLTADKTVGETVKFMVEKKTNSVIVVDEDNKPVGILSSFTLVRAVVPSYLQGSAIFSSFGAEGTFDKYAEKIKDNKIEEYMHKDFHALTEGDAMIEAATYSIKASRRILPVVNKESGVLIGAITRTCIKNAFYNTLYKHTPVEIGGDFK